MSIRYALATSALACASWCAGALGCGPAADVADGPRAADDEARSATASKDDGREHAIRMSWPSQVGERGQLRAESHEKRRERINRKDGSVGTETTAIDVVASGLHEVLEVDEHGRAVAVLMTDATVMSKRGDDAVPLEMSGARLYVKRAATASEATVTVDDVPADASLRDALDELISLTILPDANQSTEDGVFGTADKKRVGETWPVEAEAARRTLNHGWMSIPEGGLSGTMQLAAIQDVRGVECLDIVGEMDVKGFDVAKKPPGARTVHGHMKVRTRALVPTEAMPRLEDEMTMTTTLAITLPGAGLVEVTTTKELKTTYVPLEARSSPP